MNGYGAPNSYRSTEVLSTSPERLVPLLYEHLLVNLRRGILHIQRENIEGRLESLGRSLDILSELLAALDFERGGEVAPRLASLYAFWTQEISSAGRAMDTQRLEKVAAMVESLGGAWDEACQSLEEAGAPAS